MLSEEMYVCEIVNVVRPITRNFGEEILYYQRVDILGLLSFVFQDMP